MLGNPEDLGVTPRAIAAVFDHIANTPDRKFLLRATYIEIYNEVIRDLLMPANDNLKVHEDPVNKRVFVNAKEVTVSSVEQVMQVIAAGERARAVGETKMNNRSSRSHAIFTLKIESHEISDSSKTTGSMTTDRVAVRSSTLSLVDLAGSERASSTKAQGKRLVEGSHINKSLLTLGTVINKLSSGDKTHIPYRNSKLTRLLQPALGGNARTAIIAAITPAVQHIDETLSTLKFASRAKKVTNSAKKNEFLDDRTKLMRAEKLIASLKKQLKELNEGSMKGSPCTPQLERSYPKNSSPCTPPLDGPSSLNRSDCRRRLFDAAGSPPRPEKQSPVRMRDFEQKFDVLVKAMSSDATPSTPHCRADESTSTTPRSTPASVFSSLCLIGSPRRKKTSSRSIVEKDCVEMARLRKRAFEAERRMREAFAEIDSMHTEHARLEKREADPVLEECKAAQAMLIDTGVKLLAVKESVKKLKMQREAAEREVVRRDSQIGELQAEIEHSRSSHDEEIARLSCEFELKLETAEVVFQENLESCHQREAEECSKRLAAEEQFSTAEKEKKSYQVLLDEECNRTGKLQNQLDSLRDNIASLQAELTVLSKEKEDVVTKLQQGIAERDGLKVDIQNAEEATKLVRKDIEELQKKENTARSALSKRQRIANVCRNVTEQRSTQGALSRRRSSLREGRKREKFFPVLQMIQGVMRGSLSRQNGSLEAGRNGNYLR